MTDCKCTKKTLGCCVLKLVWRDTRPDVNRYSGDESLCHSGIDLLRDRCSVVSIAGIKLDAVADWWVAGHQRDGNFFVWLQRSALARESRRKSVLQKQSWLVCQVQIIQKRIVPQLSVSPTCKFELLQVGWGHIDHVFILCNGTFSQSK